MSRIKPGAREVFFLMLFICACAAGWLIPTRLAIVTSPSINPTLFLVTEKKQVSEVQRGDYVYFDVMNVLTGSGGAAEKEVLGKLKGLGTSTFAKRVACREGNTLFKAGDNYFCNEDYIGTAKKKTMEGTPLTAFEFSGQVPPGFLFVSGDHVDSYDSKYFGLLRLQDVEAKLFPLF